MKGAKTVKSGYIRQYKDYRELVEEDKEQIREYMKKLIKEGLTYSQVKSVVIREKGVVVSQGLFLRELQELQAQPAELLRSFKRIKIKKTGLTEMQWLLGLLQRLLRRKIKERRRNFADLLEKFEQAKDEQRRSKLRQQLLDCWNAGGSSEMDILRCMELYRRCLYDYTKILQTSGVLPHVISEMLKRKSPVEKLRFMSSSERLEFLKKLSEEDEGRPSEI